MSDCATKENLVPKRSRIKYKPGQVEVLERVFEQNHYPDTLQQEQLADKLNVSIDRVSIWFQNRRSKFKRMRQADHVAWMRKQIFLENENAIYKNLPGTPKLPALASACHVLSPLESQVARDENAVDTVSCSPVSRTFTPASNMTAYNSQVPAANTYVHGSNTLNTPTRPHQAYNIQTLNELQQSHIPFYDIFPQFISVMTSSNVPSMHSVAQNHVTRSTCEKRNEFNTNHLPAPTCEVKKEYCSVNVTPEKVSSTTDSTAPYFGLLDSDSDSSPAKDRTLECLAQWC